MEKFKKHLNRLKKLEKGHLWLIAVGGLFGIYLLFLAAEYAFYFDRFGPMTKIAGVNVANQTKTEARDTIKKAWTEYAKSEVRLGENILIPSENVKEVKISETIDSAIEKQRKGFGSLEVYFPQDNTIQLVLNDETIGKILDKENEKVFVAFQNANIVLEPEVQITPEREGRAVHRAATLQRAKETFGNRRDNIEIEIQNTKPTVTAVEARELVDEARTAVAEDIVVKTAVGDYSIKKEELKTWLKLDRAAEDTGREYDFYDKEKVATWTGNLAKIVNRQPENAQLNIKDNHATVFVASKSGFTLDNSDVQKKILGAAIGDKIINVNGEKTEPEITEEKINDLGIKELLSVGYSEFTGSPKNRVHNIKTGATKFNGVLIKPGEDFSFNKILGPVEASTGYLPELVIINNKTEPQFGGGLCQVSSTAFRAALNAGLPIVERRAHAYPVVYYKPFGVDASIYLPKPDFVFKNDTDAHILVQTKVVGTKLYFEFYGTKMVRTVKFSGNQDGNGAVEIVEKMTPYIYDKDARGKGSFTAVFYRHIYDATGKLTDNDRFTSKYDSPENYPKVTQ